jgi:hypothetical protein
MAQVQDATVADGGAPAAALLQLMTGYWRSQATYVAAKLGVAELVAGGACSIHELAAATGTHGPALHRLMRALASVGVFAVEDGRYALTPIGALLQTGTMESMHALAVMYNEEQYRAWGDLLHGVRTGAVPFEHVYGMPVFEYFATNAEPGRVFNDAMTSWSSHVAGAVATSYDFSQLGTVVDIGGGHGALLASILQRQPNCRGVLFDLPHVVATAGQPLRAAGVDDRCDLIGGDFFIGPLPADGDAYVLAQILHDWDDDRSLAILTQCRRMMTATSRLLVVEFVIPPGNQPSPGKWLDLHMLVMASGRERTATEFTNLFRAAGFTLTDVVSTPTGLSVIEGHPI